MATTTTTLFDKIGGSAAVEAVVKEFYTRVLADKDLKNFFDKTDMDAQTKSQIDFITMAIGGPNHYEGRPMKEAHEGMGITEMHFDKVATHLVETLAWGGVGQDDINEIVSVVGPLKAQIVEA